MDEYPKTLFKGGEAKECRTNGDEAQARAQGYTEPYKFQEYPKHLYKNGLRVVTDDKGKESPSEERIVDDKDEEDEARADGFLMLSDVAPEPEAAVASKSATKSKKKD